MSEEQGLSELRENMLESLRTMQSDAAGEAVADFTPIEEAFVGHARRNADRKHDRADQALSEALTVEAEERKRQIKNSRAIGNMNRTLGDPEKWR